MRKFLRRKVAPVVDQPNPMLDVEHPHNWLEANDGTELVCGDCGLRKTVV